MTVAVDQLSLHGTPEPLPRWVRLLDTAALALLVTAVLLIPGDGIRFGVGPIRISIVSAARVAMWAALVIVARHAFYRTPALPARVADWLRSGVAWPDVRFVGQVLLATRLPPILIGLLAVAVIGIGTPVGYQPYDNPLLNLPARWDAIWYSQIAAFGYTFDGNPLRQQSIVFFPGFPLAIRLVYRFMGGQVFYAAWFVALAAFALAIHRFVRLARHHLDERSAADSAWLLASYPFAVYFSAPYSEGLFLLATCAVFLAMHEQRFGSAAFWGLAAGLIRPNGWLLAIPIFLLAFYRQPWPGSGREWLRRALPVAAPVAGLLLFMAFPVLPVRRRARLDEGTGRMGARVPRPASVRGGSAAVHPRLGSRRLPRRTTDRHVEHRRGAAGARSGVADFPPARPGLRRARRRDGAAAAADGRRHVDRAG